ncbi:hypothetical protein [Streptomyces sp. A5-4]|uniref:hypothetical protein n=1 Tax=Streptomyces sp. A5-4 TaxID=3384771 RepID=UPI003DA903A2
MSSSPTGRAGSCSGWGTTAAEWHEGSTIEPASSSPPGGHGYLTYVGAHGKTGAAAETAYLDRTKHWTTAFEAKRRALKR